LSRTAYSSLAARPIEHFGDVGSRAEVAPQEVIAHSDEAWEF
jgi:hypothetical protein